MRLRSRALAFKDSNRSICRLQKQKNTDILFAAGMLRSGWCVSILISVKQKRWNAHCIEWFRCTLIICEEIKRFLREDIAAAVGMKYVTTGDTLCWYEYVVVLEGRWNFQSPVHICCPFEPRSPGAIRTKNRVLRWGKLAQEDPSFRVETHEEDGPNNYFR